MTYFEAVILGLVQGLAGLCQAFCSLAYFVLRRNAPLSFLPFLRYNNSNKKYRNRRRRC